MPTKASADQHTTRSIHQGRHLNSHSERLATKMDRAIQDGKKNNWTQGQYNDALRQIVRDERMELKAGNVKLNVNCRPWAKEQN